MATAFLILPDFLLILAGFALRRLAPMSSEAWAGIERLTYFVLFPALLFHANARASIDFAAAGPMLATAGAGIATGIALGLVGKVLFQPPKAVFGAGFQCAFRFNSYIGFALAGRLLGDEGIVD